MLAVINSNNNSSSGHHQQQPEAGLVDVIDEADEEDDQQRPVLRNGLITSAAAERAVVINGLEVLTDNSSASPTDSTNTATDAPQHLEKNADMIHQVSTIDYDPSVPLSSWLMPELAKVAETLQLLRSKLPSTAANQGVIEDAISNALEATRRVADEYANTADDDLANKAVYSNSDYQTLSHYAVVTKDGDRLHDQMNGESRDDHNSLDYQKLALMNGLTRHDDSGNYEATVMATLSDEDEYDRLAYEFPIHPSMRNRSVDARIRSLPMPPPIDDDDDENVIGSPHMRPHFFVPRPVLVDVASGRSQGNVLTTEKACNTYRVLSVSRPVQAVELPTAKFSKHVQTHVLVTEKCVGNDDDDEFGYRRQDAEIQTDDVCIKPPRSTEESWAQTEDKFTENVSVHANLFREFGQAASTQTAPLELPQFVPSPPPLVVPAAPTIHRTIPMSPRSVTPTISVPSNISVTPSHTRRQYSVSSSSGGSLRSPSSTSTPVSNNNTGCYQLFVRIDQNNLGSTANLRAHPAPSGNQSKSSNSTVSHGPPVRTGTLLSTSSIEVPPSDRGMSPSLELHSVTASASTFLGSSVVSSTMSPPTSDSQTATTNEHSLSDDRASSPRSWQSPVHISGPSESSPVLSRPTAPPRNRRASLNPQAQPFYSGNLAASADTSSAAYKSLIKITEGSPPEIRQTLPPDGENARPQSPGAGKGQNPHYTQGSNKTVTKIIHRLERDPSIRAWCSVDNLLRQSVLSASCEDLTGIDLKVSGQATPLAKERAMSPPLAYHDFSPLSKQAAKSSSNLNKEMAVDCANVNIGRRRNKFQPKDKPTQSKSMQQLSVPDDSSRAQQPHPPTSGRQHKPGHKQRVTHQQYQRMVMDGDSVVCLGRRTLVSVGSEDSDYSVMEAPYDKQPRRTNRNQVARQYQNQRRSNCTNANGAGRLRSTGDFNDSKRSGSMSSSSNNSSNSNSGGVFSRLTSFLHLGASKPKRMPVAC